VNARTIAFFAVGGGLLAWVLATAALEAWAVYRARKAIDALSKRYKGEP